MEQFDALEVIARTRGKVEMDDNATGNHLFPLWGWLTAFFYLLEFVLWMHFRQDWCTWMWVGIPLVGMPLMFYLIRKDFERTHMRSRGSKLVLDYWIFAACVIGISGFLFGFVGVYEIVENPLICILVGIGTFITGEEVRFRPMLVGGIAGVVIGIVAFCLQGEFWHWQLLCIVLCALVAMIIPGHLFEKSVKNGI
ncbi:MAG: hypothetical protein J6X57_06050 [Bacteroidales bacterium]|nr:hypothetical protein [Bacteroidales bacterium]